MTDLEQLISGLWEIHPIGMTVFGAEKLRRRPRSHIEFRRPEWRLYETGRRHRLPYAGNSRGPWHIVALNEDQALLVLTVQSYRPSRASQAAVESNYAYSGGAIAVAGARAQRENEERKMRDGEAKMYFMPVRIRSEEIIMAVPSNGRLTPRQQWVRLE